MFEQIGKHLWRYHDETGSTSYLLVGESCAAMIDCGCVVRPLMEEIRKITVLPVKLLLTHAHPDHFGAAGSFSEVWMHEDDIVALPVFEPSFAVMGVPALRRETLHAFTDGDEFDLGGMKVVACALPGHTPGSTVFVCEEEALLFIGDAIGSGDIVLMSVPLAYDVSAYRASLVSFYERCAPWATYAWHSGHYHQAQRGEGQAPNTPCRELVDDMIALCGALLAGEIEGEPREEIFAPGGRSRRAYLGRAGMVYSDEQLK